MAFFNKKYYTSTFECLDNCKGNGFQIVPTSSTTIQQCLGTCNGYYNFDSNICLSHCGADGSNKKYHRYGDNRCYSSCAEISNGIYIYELLEINPNSIIGKKRPITLTKKQKNDIKIESKEKITKINNSGNINFKNLFLRNDKIFCFKKRNFLDT